MRSISFYTAIIEGFATENYNGTLDQVHNAEECIRRIKLIIKAAGLLCCLKMSSGCRRGLSASTVGAS